MYETRSAPVILVGAHRSGTSAVTERLAQFGLFVGARTDSHAESTFFQRLNRRLSNEAGGHWTTPRAVTEGLQRRQNLDLFAAPLRRQLNSLAAAEFWGVRNQAQRLSGPWGWKDPRNTYLYPLWTAVFPDRKLLSIQRDPLASARSLVRRTAEVRDRIETESGPKGELRRVTRSLRGNPILADGWLTMDLAGALEVALNYREMQAELAAAESTQVHIINYEDLIANPADVLAGCATFCGLTPSAQAVEGAAATIVARSHGPRSQESASKPLAISEEKGMQFPDPARTPVLPEDLAQRRAALGYT